LTVLEEGASPYGLDFWGSMLRGLRFKKQGFGVSPATPWRTARLRGLQPLQYAIFGICYLDAGICCLDDGKCYLVVGMWYLNDGICYLDDGRGLACHALAHCESSVSCTEVSVSGFDFQSSSFGFRVSVSGFGFRISGFGFRVSGFGFGFRVSEFTALGFNFKAAKIWKSCAFRVSLVRFRSPLIEFGFRFPV